MNTRTRWLTYSRFLHALISGAVDDLHQRHAEEEQNRDRRIELKR